ncbi:MAG: WYL domain-containing protein [Pseudomonadota bacterium]
MNELPMTADDLKWDVRQRLKLLESTLLLSGWVRTQALMERFGISRAQASKDFTVYQTLRPRNLVYNKSRKYYEAGSDFEPLLLTGKTSELLDVLGAAPHGDGPVLALAAQAPAVELLRPMERELDLRVFRAISMAAYNKVKLRLAYQSMNKPEPAELTLSPHTLVFSGFRWHVRAFSDTHGEYRDFVLARVRGLPEVLDASGVTADGDVAWHTQVRVVIGPHPDLPEAQQAIIAEDYGMTDGRCELWMRSVLAPYFLRLMQLEPGREHPNPKVQQIVLLNGEDMAPLLMPT